MPNGRYLDRYSRTSFDCQTQAARHRRQTHDVRLHPEEPEARAWEPLADDELALRVNSMLPADGKVLILVDGRSGAGKSTFAARLGRLLGGVVVHSDDIAWHDDPIDWADLLVDGVLEPWRQGESVSFRPPRWVARGRQGAVEVPPGRVLLVEGVGVSRASLADRAELVVWVQSDHEEARRRGIERDVGFGRTPAEAEAFWDEWMRSEDPFLADDRPWTRAALLVNGTPAASTADCTLVAPGPLVQPAALS